MQDATNVLKHRTDTIVLLGMVLALTIHWSLLPLALIAAGIMDLRRNETLAAISIGCGALLLLGGIGYALGKQAALRDNLLCQQTPQQCPRAQALTVFKSAFRSAPPYSARGDFGVGQRLQLSVLKTVFPVHHAIGQRIMGDHQQAA